MERIQGGLTGYLVGDPPRGLTEMETVIDQAYDWFINVQQVQVEELALLTVRGVEIASLGRDWPRFSLPVEGGVSELPDIWVR